MSRHPAVAPGALLQRAFSVAEARSLGLSAKMLRRPGLRAPHYGVRSLVGTSPDPTNRSQQMRRIALDYLPRLRRDRGELISHASALLAVGAPIHVPLELHVTIPRPHSPARGKNVRGHRGPSTAAFIEVEEHGVRLPCAAPADALVQAASLLDFKELVVAADHLIRERGPHWNRSSLATLEELTAAAAASSAPSVQRLRAALRVARVGSESRMESLQHFELARMGIDELELQGDVYDEAGVWIGRFDAVDRERKRILEYDGEQHRTDRKQYLHDKHRLDRARKAGWEIMHTHWEDFQPRRIAQTRADMCAFLGRRPRPIPRVLTRYFAECEG